MNCSQARALLAIYRELDTEEIVALNAHLATCPACRAVKVQYEHVGVRIRTLPVVEPAEEAHSSLMQALALEHMRFLQRAPASTTTPPTPTFLAPYLRDLAHNAPETDHLAAFSTADTGPLPVLQPLKPRRARLPNHLAIIGMAASILFVLMAGSLASLLLLSSRGVSPSAVKTSYVFTSEVQSQNHTVSMAYPHIASAIEVDDTVYYTTYSDNRANWQLERFDTQKQTSTPLLNKPASQELIILGGSQDWLVWLQIDVPKQTTTPQTTGDGGRAWSLHVLRLNGKTTADTNTTATTTGDGSIALITNKKFNTDVIPSWVHKPIQGISFYQNTLLVAMIDEKGNAHLLSYALDKLDSAPVELDSASNGHILASPTATSDGNSIYWAEEWFDGKNLQSNIWTRQMLDASPTAGRWAAHKEAHTYLFHEDGQSFRPQIVSDTLFILSTNTTGATTIPTPTVEQTPATTPGATAQSSTPTPTPTATEVDPSKLPGGALKVDASIFKPQIDETQSGKILTFTAEGVATTLQRFDDTITASALQGGTHFLLWLDANGRVGMFDVASQVPVSVGAAVPQDTAFLAVNGDTAVVILSTDDNAQADKNVIPINTLRWPWPIKKTQKTA